MSSALRLITGPSRLGLPARRRSASPRRARPAATATRRRPPGGRSRGSPRCSAGRSCRTPTRGSPSTARSRSASSMTMIAFLPPSSRWTCLRWSAAAFVTATPVSREPVNVITGDVGMARRARSPPPRPAPWTRLTTPGGRPASDEQLDEALGEQRRVLGRLQHDRVAADERGRELPGRDRDREVPRRDQRRTTPIGMRTLILNLSGSSDGVVWPKRRRPSPAM